jgi:hypothetical protein
MTLREWRDKGRAPYKMIRGASVMHGSIAYFMNWDGQTCCYDVSTHIWNELPQCPGPVETAL